MYFGSDHEEDVGSAERATSKLARQMFHSNIVGSADHVTSELARQDHVGIGGVSMS